MAARKCTLGLLLYILWSASYGHAQNAASSFYKTPVYNGKTPQQNPMYATCNYGACNPPVCVSNSQTTSWNSATSTVATPCSKVTSTQQNNAETTSTITPFAPFTPILKVPIIPQNILSTITKPGKISESATKVSQSDCRNGITFALTGPCISDAIKKARSTLSNIPSSNSLVAPEPCSPISDAPNFIAKVAVPNVGALTTTALREPSFSQGCSGVGGTDMSRIPNTDNVILSDPKTDIYQDFNINPCVNGENSQAKANVAKRSWKAAKAKTMFPSYCVNEAGNTIAPQNVMANDEQDFEVEKQIIDTKEDEAGNYVYPAMPQLKKAPIHACLAGYDGEIYKIIRDIKETTGTEIEVHFYLFRNCKFEFLGTHKTNLKFLQEILAKYHHYICLNKEYVESYKESDQCWYVEKLIMIPSFANGFDLSHSFNAKDFTQLCSGKSNLGFEPLALEIEEKVSPKDVHKMNQIIESENKQEVLLHDIIEGKTTDEIVNKDQKLDKGGVRTNINVYDARYFMENPEENIRLNYPYLQPIKKDFNSVYDNTNTAICNGICRIPLHYGINHGPNGQIVPSYTWGSKIPVQLNQNGIPYAEVNKHNYAEVIANKHNQNDQSLTNFARYPINYIQSPYYNIAGGVPWWKPLPENKNKYVNSDKTVYKHGELSHGFGMNNEKYQPKVQGVVYYNANSKTGDQKAYYQNIVKPEELNAQNIAAIPKELKDKYHPNQEYDTLGYSEADNHVIFQYANNLKGGLSCQPIKDRNWHEDVTSYIKPKPKLSSYRLSQESTDNKDNYNTITSYKPKDMNIKYQIIDHVTPGTKPSLETANQVRPQGYQNIISRKGITPLYVPQLIGPQYKIPSGTKRTAYDTISAYTQQQKKGYTWPVKYDAVLAQNNALKAATQYDMVLAQNIPIKYDATLAKGNVINAESVSNTPNVNTAYYDAQYGPKRTQYGTTYGKYDLIKTQFGIKPRIGVTPLQYSLVPGQYNQNAAQYGVNQVAGSNQAEYIPKQPQMLTIVPNKMTPQGEQAIFAQYVTENKPCVSETQYGMTPVNGTQAQYVTQQPKPSLSAAQYSTTPADVIQAQYVTKDPLAVPPIQYDLFSGEHTLEIPDARTLEQYGIKPELYRLTPENLQMTDAQYNPTQTEFGGTLNKKPGKYSASPSEYDTMQAQYSVTSEKYGTTPRAYNMKLAKYNRDPAKFDTTPLTYDTTADYYKDPAKYGTLPLKYDTILKQQANLGKYDKVPVEYDIIHGQAIPAKYKMKSPVTFADYNLTPEKYGIRSGKIYTTPEVRTGYDIIPGKNGLTTTQYNKKPVKYSQVPIEYDLVQGQTTPANNYNNIQSQYAAIPGKFGTIPVGYGVPAQYNKTPGKYGTVPEYDIVQTQATPVNYGVNPTVNLAEYRSIPGRYIKNPNQYGTTPVKYDIFQGQHGIKPTTYNEKPGILSEYTAIPRNYSTSPIAMLPAQYAALLGKLGLKPGEIRSAFPMIQAEYTTKLGQENTARPRQGYVTPALQADYGVTQTQNIQYDVYPGLYTAQPGKFGVKPGDMTTTPETYAQYGLPNQDKTISEYVAQPGKYTLKPGQETMYDNASPAVQGKYDIITSENRKTQPNIYQTGIYGTKLGRNTITPTIQAQYVMKPNQAGMTISEQSSKDPAIKAEYDVRTSQGRSTPTQYNTHLENYGIKPGEFSVRPDIQAQYSATPGQDIMTPAIHDVKSLDRATPIQLSIQPGKYDIKPGTNNITPILQAQYAVKPEQDGMVLAEYADQPGKHDIKQGQIHMPPQTGIKVMPDQEGMTHAEYYTKPQPLFSASLLKNKAVPLKYDPALYGVPVRYEIIHGQSDVKQKPIEGIMAEYSPVQEKYGLLEPNKMTETQYTAKPEQYAMPSQYSITPATYSQIKPQYNSPQPQLDQTTQYDVIKGRYDTSTTQQMIPNQYHEYLSPNNANSNQYGKIAQNTSTPGLFNAILARYVAKPLQNIPILAQYSVNPALYDPKLMQNVPIVAQYGMPGKNGVTPKYVSILGLNDPKSAQYGVKPVLYDAITSEARETVIDPTKIAVTAGQTILIPAQHSTAPVKTDMTLAEYVKTPTQYSIADKTIMKPAQYNLAPRSTVLSPTQYGKVPNKVFKTPTKYFETFGGTGPAKYGRPFNQYGTYPGNAITLGQYEIMPGECYRKPREYYFDPRVQRIIPAKLSTTHGLYGATPRVNGVVAGQYTPMSPQYREIFAEYAEKPGEKSSIPVGYATSPEKYSTIPEEYATTQIQYASKLGKPGTISTHYTSIPGMVPAIPAPYAATTGQYVRIPGKYTSSNIPQQYDVFQGKPSVTPEKYSTITTPSLYGVIPQKNGVVPGQIVPISPQYLAILAQYATKAGKNGSMPIFYGQYDPKLPGNGINVVMPGKYGITHAKYASNPVQYDLVAGTEDFIPGHPNTVLAQYLKAPAKYSKTPIKYDMYQSPSFRPSKPAGIYTLDPEKYFMCQGRQIDTPTQPIRTYSLSPGRYDLLQSQPRLMPAVPFRKHTQVSKDYDVYQPRVNPADSSRKYIQTAEGYDNYQDQPRVNPAKYSRKHTQTPAGFGYQDQPSFKPLQQAVTHAEYKESAIDYDSVIGGNNKQKNRPKPEQQAGILAQYTTTKEFNKPGGYYKDPGQYGTKFQGYDMLQGFGSVPVEDRAKEMQQKGILAQYVAPKELGAAVRYDKDPSHYSTKIAGYDMLQDNYSTVPVGLQYVGPPGKYISLEDRSKLQQAGIFAQYVTPREDSTSKYRTIPSQYGTKVAAYDVGKNGIGQYGVAPCKHGLTPAQYGTKLIDPGVLPRTYDVSQGLHAILPEKQGTYPTQYDKIPGQRNGIKSLRPQIKLGDLGISAGNYDNISQGMYAVPAKCSSKSAQYDIIPGKYAAIPEKFEQNVIGSTNQLQFGDPSLAAGKYDKLQSQYAVTPKKYGSNPSQYDILPGEYAAIPAQINKHSIRQYKQENKLYLTPAQYKLPVQYITTSGEEKYMTQAQYIAQQPIIPDLQYYIDPSTQRDKPTVQETPYTVIDKYTKANPIETKQYYNTVSNIQTAKIHYEQIPSYSAQIPNFNIDNTRSKLGEAYLKYLKPTQVYTYPGREKNNIIDSKYQPVYDNKKGIVDNLVSTLPYAQKARTNNAADSGYDIIEAYNPKPIYYNTVSHYTPIKTGENFVTIPHYSQKQSKPVYQDILHYTPRNMPQTYHNISYYTKPQQTEQMKNILAYKTPTAAQDFNKIPSYLTTAYDTINAYTPKKKFKNTKAYSPFIPVQYATANAKAYKENYETIDEYTTAEKPEDYMNIEAYTPKTSIPLANIQGSVPKENYNIIRAYSKPVQTKTAEDFTFVHTGKDMPVYGQSNANIIKPDIIEAYTHPQKESPKYVSYITPQMTGSKQRVGPTYYQGNKEMYDKIEAYTPKEKFNKYDMMSQVSLLERLKPQNNIYAAPRGTEYAQNIFSYTPSTQAQTSTVFGLPRSTENFENMLPYLQRAPKYDVINGYTKIKPKLPYHVVTGFNNDARRLKYDTINAYTVNQGKSCENFVNAPYVISKVKDEAQVIHKYRQGPSNLQYDTVSGYSTVKNPSYGTMTNAKPYMRGHLGDIKEYPKSEVCTEKYDLTSQYMEPNEQEQIDVISEYTKTRPKNVNRIAPEKPKQVLVSLTEPISSEFKHYGENDNNQFDNIAAYSRPVTPKFDYLAQYTKPHYGQAPQTLKYMPLKVAANNNNNALKYKTPEFQSAYYTPKTNFDTLSAKHQVTPNYYNYYPGTTKYDIYGTPQSKYGTLYAKPITKYDTVAYTPSYQFIDKYTKPQLKADNVDTATTNVVTGDQRPYLNYMPYVTPIQEYQATQLKPKYYKKQNYNTAAMTKPVYFDATTKNKVTGDQPQYYYMPYRTPNLEYQSSRLKPKYVTKQQTYNTATMTPKTIESSNTYSPAQSYYNTKQTYNKLGNPSDSLVYYNPSNYNTVNYGVKQPNRSFIANYLPREQFDMIDKYTSVDNQPTNDKKQRNNNVSQKPYEYGPDQRIAKYGVNSQYYTPIKSELGVTYQPYKDIYEMVNKYTPYQDKAKYNVINEYTDITRSKLGSRTFATPKMAPETANFVAKNPKYETTNGFATPYKTLIPTYTNINQFYTPQNLQYNTIYGKPSNAYMPIEQRQNLVNKNEIALQQIENSTALNASNEETLKKDTENKSALDNILPNTEELRSYIAKLIASSPKAKEDLINKGLPLKPIVIQEKLTPETSITLKTEDKNVDIKGIVAKLSVLKPKIVFDLDEVQVVNFIPIVKNSEGRDLKTIQDIARRAVNTVYKEPIVLKGPTNTKNILLNTIADRPSDKAIIWPAVYENNSWYQRQRHC